MGVEKKLSKEEIKNLFSAWDGSQNELVRTTKERMHDSDAFEHVETTYSRQKNKVFVQMKFRGKNSLGATVINSAYGLIDPNTRQITEFLIK